MNYELQSVLHYYRDNQPYCTENVIKKKGGIIRRRSRRRRQRRRSRKKEEVEGEGRGKWRGVRK